MSIAKVAATVTKPMIAAATVTAMVTQRRRHVPKPPEPRRAPFYLKEWRKFRGVKAVDLAIALSIERESYYRLEKQTWKIRLGQVEILAATIGIRPNQFRFPPPTHGGHAQVSIDDMLDDVPENIREIAMNAVRGIIRR